MKMVSAAKLRRAQEQAEAGRPYADRMGRMISALAAAAGGGNGPKLLAGTGSEQVQLVVVMTADRGLCGGFNSSIARLARQAIRRLQGEGKQVKVLCVGRKGRDALRREFGDLIIETIEGYNRPSVAFQTANDVAGRLLTMFDDGEFDVCSLIFNRFQSAMTQIGTESQIIPARIPEAAANDSEDGGLTALYEYEPDEEAILEALLPRNVATQVYSAMLENNASEHGARMTAMDSATRNAGDMIDRLTLNYNRTRQAAITKELIEIISGAEAL
jgi:F-type H+-transporting ATPase subunit gamma